MPIADSSGSLVGGLGLPHGNLAELARSAGNGWWVGAARGFLSIDAVVQLQLIGESNPHACFALAAAHWIGGDTKAAAALLAGLPNHRSARRLAALIAQPQIDVLSFFPQDRKQPHQLALAGAADGKFQLRNVSFAPGDLANGPDADIRNFYTDGRPPDFVVAEMVEWQLLPRNLRACPAPLIGHTSDFDLHIQSVLPWLQQFDALLTVGDSEWAKLAALIGPEHCLVYPAVFSVEPEELPPPGVRSIDFVLTQTVFSSSHRDKEAVLKRIIEVPGLDYVLHNGNMPLGSFQRLLQASKLTLSFIRHPESMPTRAMEALAAGCCCLIPPSSTLHLYVPPEHGLVPVDFDDPAALEHAILAVTRNELVRYQEAARRGAALMRSRFSATEVGTRYLRFLTVLAAVIGDAPVRRPAPELLLQKHHACWLGPKPDNGKIETMAALRASNLELGTALPEERRFNEAGRDAVLNYELFARRQRAPSSPELAAASLEAFRLAIAVAPDALAPAFNFIRTAFHFGDEVAKVEATCLAQTVLARPKAIWRLTFADDLLAYDFYQSHAPTRRFTELLIDLATDGPDARAALIDGILATIHFYLGWYHETLASFRQCHALQPDFVEGRLQLARRLVETGEPEAALEAIEHLRWLGARYVMTAELPDLLARAQRLADLPEDAAQPSRGLRVIDNLGDYYADFSIVASASRHRFAQTERLVWRRSEGARAVSLVLVDRHQRWRMALEGLARTLRYRNSDIEIVHADLFACIDERALVVADVALRDLWPTGVVEHLGRAFAGAFAEASGDVLIFAERLDGVDANDLASAVAEIKARPLDRLVALAWPEPEMPTPRPQLVILSRSLFLTLGGFDLSFACQGPRGGVRELVWRARNAGVDLLGFDRAPVPWAAELSLSDGALKPIAEMIAIAGKPEWGDRSRSAPIYSDPHIRALKTAISGSSCGG